MLMLKKKNKFTYEKRLEKYWEDSSASEQYRLVRYEIDSRDRLTGNFSCIAFGDKDWANKVAKHYNIEVTPQLLEDDAYDDV